MKRLIFFIFLVNTVFSSSSTEIEENKNDQPSKILVTGCAGFIGFHTTLALLKQGKHVLGVDNLNEYYDPNLKKARLDILRGSSSFTFEEIDISEKESTNNLARQYPDIQEIIHLAAQAGVRYSVENPHAYIESNVTGQLNMLEICKILPHLKHFVYASSSSVYGANTKMPFSEEDKTDHPVSVYAASKKSCETLAFTYSSQYKIPTTGLRFFTVYGPWGRPDMAVYIFTQKILSGEPIQVFNNGDMRRNFTYIDDIVDGILKSLEHPPISKIEPTTGQAAVPYEIYNLGNDKSESLIDFINLLEKHLGRSTKKVLFAMQQGDVKDTVADINKAQQNLGFQPKTDINDGLKKFVDWYVEYHRTE